MRLPHRACVSRPDARGYDAVMTPSRFFLLATFAALAAAAVRAESDPAPRPEEKAEAPQARLVSPDAPAVPNRYSRDAYTPMRDTRAAPSRRYDAREQRIEALRTRYAMPREMSQDMHAAIEQAQRAHGGKVLSADRLNNDGRDVYRVKLLTPNGRVRVVQLQKPESSPAPQAREQQGEQ